MSHGEGWDVIEAWWGGARLRGTARAVGEAIAAAEAYFASPPHRGYVTPRPQPGRPASETPGAIRSRRYRARRRLETSSPVTGRDAGVTAVTLERNANVTPVTPALPAERREIAKPSPAEERPHHVTGVTLERDANVTAVTHGRDANVTPVTLAPAAERREIAQPSLRPGPVTAVTHERDANVTAVTPQRSDGSDSLRSDPSIDEAKALAKGLSQASMEEHLQSEEVIATFTTTHGAWHLKRRLFELQYLPTFAAALGGEAELIVAIQILAERSRTHKLKSHEGTAWLMSSLKKELMHRKGAREQANYRCKQGEEAKARAPQQPSPEERQAADEARENAYKELRACGLA